MTQPIIVGLGEILWDVFPDGPRFGGAPANFACTAAGLGGDRVTVHMVSSVGEDELGAKAIEALRQRGVDTSYVSHQPKPTGKVLVKLDEAGRASYDFASDTAWDNLSWSLELEQLANRTHACCFGSLGQRNDASRQTIQRFVGAMEPSSLRIFDVNLRPPYVSDSVLLDSLGLANVLKLNEEELPIVGKLCGITGDEVATMRQLAQRYDLHSIALTRGPHGAMLLRGNEVADHQGVETEVVDTVGAGDAFTAAMAVGLLNGQALDTILQTATSTAAYVCSQSGATPPVKALSMD